SCSSMALSKPKSLSTTISTILSWSLNDKSSVAQLGEASTVSTLMLSKYNALKPQRYLTATLCLKCCNMAQNYYFFYNKKYFTELLGVRIIKVPFKCINNFLQ